MRILQLCTAFYAGGIQRHAMALGTWLRDRDHDIFFAGAPGPWLDETTEFDFQPLDLMEVAKEGGSTFPRIIQAIKCAIKLRSFLKINKIELIHAHESAPVIVAKLASLGMGLPILVTYHGSAPERVKSFGRIGRLTAQRILTPSHRCATDLHEQAGVPKKMLKVLGLGVEPPPVISDERIERHRKKLLGPDGKLLVVVIARLAHQKGIDTLVEVVRLVKENRHDIRFVVIGDGPLRNQVEMWTANAGVESLLTFDGESNEPYLYLKAADLFLLTSRWEALPIAIAEAFQAGLPVVATDTGGVTELVTESVGRVVPSGDTGALSTSVLEICADQELRLKMSAEAIKLAREDRFSFSHIHKSFERFYADILGVSL